MNHPLLIGTILLLGGLQWVFHVEWTTNEQYGFGLFVPALTGFLLWRRWKSRPEPGPLQNRKPSGTVSGVALFGCGALGFHFLFLSNPDWRLLLWAYALLSVITGTALAFASGGTTWARAALPSWLLILTAVPWPTRIETPLIDLMMHLVALLVAETLLLSGIVVEVAGNILYLEQGPVGVEEACSGIRSFQLALMCGWFLGELLRFGLFRRGFLLGGAALIALTTNYLRTLGLTLLVHNGGPDLMDKWHDTVGLFAMGGTVLLVFLLATALRLPRDAERASAISGSLGSRRPRLVAGLAAIYLSAFAVSETYYRLHESESGDRLLSIDPDTLPEDWEFVRVSASARSILRYSESFCGVWPIDDGIPASLYLFTWEARRISSNAGLHRPEICLPSTGWIFEESFPVEHLPVGEDGATVPLTPHRFIHQSGTPMIVYFGVWSANSTDENLQDLGSFDRIRQALDGKRIGDRQSLGLYFPAISQLDQARELLTGFLQQRATITTRRES